jgi:beta-barrel assembly-enhancing protease
MEEQMKLREARVSYLRQTSLPNKGGALLQIRRDLQQVVAVVVAVVLTLAPLAWAERTQLKPGWNLFSPEQDAQLGRQVSRDAERQVPMLNDARVDAYLNSLGRRLAAHAPYHYFQYQFKCVNDRAINAFALPGGFVYINRGVLEAADNEAQVAGVMAHEISHVELRHGTNQATKAYAWQVPLGVLGGALGNNAVGAVAQAIGGFAVNSVLLKYSRTAESQADILGTQILYDSGYDARAMAQFFEKIEAESKGRSPAEFFSNHPSPEHRIERVNDEVEKLGGPPSGYKTDSAEFREIKRYVLSLPAPPKGGRPPQQASGGRSRRPDQPSSHLQSYENEALRMSYPDNWRPNGQGSAVSFVPAGGVVDDGRGKGALAYGMIVNIFEPHHDRSEPVTVEDATDQLIDDMRHSNPGMRVVRQHERIRLDGERGLSTYLSNDSPASGRETDWLVTVLRPEGLIYFVCVAPEREYDEYDRTFEAMLNSVRFRR